MSVLPGMTGLPALIGRAPAWTPANDPNLLMWLDGSDDDTITITSEVVSGWVDKVTGTRTLTNTNTGNRPSLGSINSRQAISFPGGKALRVGSLSMPQPITIIRLLSLTTLSGTHRVDGDAPDNLVRVAGGAWAINAGAGAVNTSVSPATGEHIIASIVDGADTEFYANGVAGTWVSSGATTKTQITLGASNLIGGSSLIGLIGEYLIVNGALSIADRQRYEGYLAHRWEETSLLPGDHPYKTVAP